VESVPVDLRDVAVRVALEEGDTSLWVGVCQRMLRTEDYAERQRLLSALASVDDDRGRLALGLTLHPALQPNEILAVLGAQLYAERTREAAWEYLKHTIDALVARAGESAEDYVLGVAASVCDVHMADRLEAFFAPRFRRSGRDTTRLAAAVESLRLCAASADLQRSGAEAFFSHLPR
jgi:hypothetical protein